MSKTTLADIERLCWHLSGWQVDQRSVDALLKAVAAYAGYGPGEESQSSDAAAPTLEGGAGEAVRAPEPLVAPTPADDISEPVKAPQAAVQRVEVTGTLTLLCPGLHTPPDPARIPPPRKARIPGDPHESQRRCGKCERTLPVEEFARDAKGRNGLRYACRDCENTRKRESARRVRAAKLAAREAQAA